MKTSLFCKKKKYWIVLSTDLIPKTKANLNSKQLEFISEITLEFVEIHNFEHDICCSFWLNQANRKHSLDDARNWILI